MANSNFTTQWKNLLCEELYSLQQEGTFCDTSIESFDGMQYMIHSCILAAGSVDFRNQETVPPFMIQCNQTSGAAISLLIRMLYTGSFGDGPISIDELKGVCTAACDLGLEQITEMVTTLIQELQSDGQTELTGDQLETASLPQMKLEKLENNDADADEEFKLDDDSEENNNDDFEDTQDVEEISIKREEVSPSDKESVTSSQRLSTRQHKFDPRVIEFLKGSKKKAKKRKREVNISDEESTKVEYDLNYTSDGVYEPQTEYEVEILDSEKVKIKGKLNAYKCSICGKIYGKTTRAKTFFAKHKLAHVIESPAAIKCTECEYYFENLKGVTDHKQLVHNIVEEFNSNAIYPQTDVPWKELKEYVLKEEKFIRDHKIMFRCSICHQEKCGYENFLGHKLRHAGRVAFSCKHCGKGFFRKTDGKRHEAQAVCVKSGRRSSYVHTKTAPDGSLKNCSFLKPEEIKKEDGKKWFECCICERAMVGYETFVAHKFDHAGMRAYQCIKCKTEFSRKSEWKRHMITSICSDISPEALQAKENSESKIICDIGDHNRERINMAIKVLETASPETLMNNLDLAHAGLVQADIELEEATNNQLQPKLNDRSLLYEYVDSFEKVESNEVPNERTYKCSICQLIFKSVTNFAIHKRKHLQAKPFKCVHCKKGFVRKWDLTAHLNIHKKNHKLKCNDCNKIFFSQLKHRKHYLQSPDCKMPEEYKSDAIHKDSYECDICGKIYSSPFYLEEHKMSHSDAHLICEICGQKFKIAKNLAVHMLRHSGTKNFACEICGKRFIRNSDVTSHMLAHSEERNVECQVCNKKFKHKNSLRSHMMIHNNVKPYTCKTCGRSFCQKGNLRKHEKETHADTYNYTCDLCKKNFYTEGGHRAHLKSHHSHERPHQCPYCEKCFVMRINLTRHIATHTDERPHPCPECNRCFRMVSHVRRHLMAVHGWDKERVMELRLKEMTKRELEQLPIMQFPAVQESLNIKKSEDVLIKLETVEDIKADDKNNAGVHVISDGMVGQVQINPIVQHLEQQEEAQQPQIVVVDESGNQVELPPGFVFAEGQQMEIVRVQGEEVIDELNAAEAGTIYMYTG